MAEKLIAANGDKSVSDQLTAYMTRDNKYVEQGQGDSEARLEHTSEVGEFVTTNIAEIMNIALQEDAERKSLPLRFDVNDLDFGSVEETFSKIADPTKAVSPQFATELTPIETVFLREDGTEYVETTNTANPGDAIITGAKGERYVLTPEEFQEMYEPLTDENGAVVDGKFLPKNIVKRIKNPTGREIVIDAPWGGDQSGESDCWIVESQINGKRYIIEARAFDGTYQLVAS